MNYLITLKGMSFVLVMHVCRFGDVLYINVDLNKKSAVVKFKEISSA